MSSDPAEARLPAKRSVFRAPCFDTVCRPRLGQTRPSDRLYPVTSGPSGGPGSSLFVLRVTGAGGGLMHVSDTTCSLSKQS